MEEGKGQPSVNRFALSGSVYRGWYYIYDPSTSMWLRSIRPKGRAAPRGGVQFIFTCLQKDAIAYRRHVDAKRVLSKVKHRHPRAHIFKIESAGPEGIRKRKVRDGQAMQQVQADVRDPAE